MSFYIRQLKILTQTRVSKHLKYKINPNEKSRNKRILLQKQNLMPEK